MKFKRVELLKWGVFFNWRIEELDGCTEFRTVFIQFKNRFFEFVRSDYEQMGMIYVTILGVQIGKFRHGLIKKDLD